MGDPKELSAPNPRSEHRLAYEVHRGTSPQNNETVYGQNQCESLNRTQNIEVHVTQQRENRNAHNVTNVLSHGSHSHLKTITRSNKAVQALNLPTVVNINPRSLNNKVESFKTYMEEEEIDLACISESHECEGRPLVNSLKLDDYEIISSMHQRRGKGGRPALIVNKLKYDVTNITNTLVNIPWGVEAVWAVLTPKGRTNDSLIQKIAVCSFYNRSKYSKFKTKLLNHISEAFNIISRKYPKGLHFILGADANHLKLDSILNLRSDMRSVVEDVTRLGPPAAMLDPIITTLGNFYQRPVCYPPLDADEGSGGVKADHLIVKMEPINMVNNKAARTYRKITVMPMPESALLKYQNEMYNHKWDNLYGAQSTHEKALVLQKEHAQIVENCFPKKDIKVSSDDCPWWTQQLQDLHRKKQRIFRKERMSLKWKALEKKYQRMKKKAKQNFYKRMVSDLVEKDDNQWYSQFKRLTNKGKSDQVDVDEISHLPEAEQAEVIADHFSAVSQEYNHLQDEDIQVPRFPQESTPHISVSEVAEQLNMIKTKKSTAAGDIPAKLIKLSADQLAAPLADVINTGIRLGQWPDIYKIETITPVPKVHPPRLLDQLRPISNLFTYSKVGEKIISNLMVQDMVKKMDPCQFGNLKSTSIQHYLISLIDRLMS